MEKLGSGASSSVFKAIDLDLDRFVAIKVLHDENSEDKQVLDVFLQEGKTLAQINHPNVVRIFSSTIDEKLKFPVLIMELVEGERFDNHIKEFQENPRMLFKCMVETLEGLEACHKKGIVHRDLKPANILLTSEGQAKIIDFGIARPPTQDLIGGQIIGTPEYMAPEQFLGETVTSKADVYALGIVFWEMLTGELPFRAEGAPDYFMALAGQHTYCSPPLFELEKIPHAAPFVPILESLLNKEPGKRCGISDFIRILKNELENGNSPRQSLSPGPVEPPDRNREEKLELIRNSLQNGDPTFLTELSERLTVEKDSVVIFTSRNLTAGNCFTVARESPEVLALNRGFSTCTTIWLVMFYECFLPTQGN